MLFLGIQKNIFTFIRIFLFGDGGKFCQNFCYIFFFKIVNLHLDGYFVSVLFTDTKIQSKCFFFLRLFFLTNQVLHYTIYIMFTNKVLHLIRAIFHIQLSFFHLQIFIKELLYVLNTLDQRDPGCKILYTVIVCFILL